ncbi:hypothetical protein [Mucilaginibacter lacusdianchii]|uniref:hypothetical protein n=1 Tax=Mucilaginibacter lacusdianchii TaxID=2684211 RepID=UPI00131D8187|nr:hypothetical protein [Mucilaginibacter sp. JXJ CY 39]
MKRVAKNLLLIGAIYFTYKVALFGIIFYINNSSYQYFDDFKMEENYGNDMSSTQVIVLGCSNSRYNFDYKLLNQKPNVCSVHSVSTKATYGLYITLKKFINSKWNQKENIVIVDLPYSLYSRDQFVLPTKETLVHLSADDYWKVAKSFPRTFFSYTSQISLFNPIISDYFKGAIKNAVSGKGSDATYADLSLKVNSNPSFKPDYINSSAPYNSKMHFIRDVDTNTGYLEDIKSYIANNIKCKVYFSLPAINKDNNSLSNSTINTISSVLKPINNFKNTQFSNEYVYDQWYHLNKRGAEINTQNLLKALSGLRISQLPNFETVVQNEN